MQHNVNSIDRIVGLNILLNRIAFGFEISELAQKIDIEANQLIQIEEGATRIGLQLLIKLAGIFDIPISKFLNSVELKSSESEGGNPMIGEIHQLINAFTKIKSQEGREKLMAMAKGLAAL